MKIVLFFCISGEVNTIPGSTEFFVLQVWL